MMHRVGLFAKHTITGVPDHAVVVRQYAGLTSALVGFLFGTTIASVSAVLFIHQNNIDLHLKAQNDLKTVNEQINLLARAMDVTRALAVHTSLKAATIEDVNVLRRDLVAAIDRVDKAQLETRSRVLKL